MGNPKAEKGGVFLSYAREDGEGFAADLKQRLQDAGVRVARDRDLLEGGVGWWNQIAEAIASVDYLVLVMTPKALESEWTKKEWQYARAQGVCVYPVKAAPDDALDFDAMPGWMRKAHFSDIDKEWDTFVGYLTSAPRPPRVPFMAPDMPAGFVERPREFDALRDHLLDADRENPIAITTALHGAGGFGKTTLAVALCHDDAVITAFDDGILWATLGEQPDVIAQLTGLYAALTGERPVFQSVYEASRAVAEKLADKNALIVIDDAWQPEHVKPFLEGAKGCARLVTTRNFDIVIEAHAETHRVNVDQMQSNEAVEMLKGSIEPEPGEGASVNDAAFAALADRLGGWPLLLGFANAALRARTSRGDSPEGAVQYVDNALTEFGLTAFDRYSESDRHAAVSRTIGVSLALLDQEALRRYRELAIFPEDTDVPLSTLSPLWGLNAFRAEHFAQRLDDYSLLKLNLQSGTIRLHDILREYLGEQLKDDAPAVHQKLLDGWGDFRALPDAYAWGHVAYHLVHAGRREELRALLLDWAFLRAKLEARSLGVGADDAATAISSLVADYDYLDEDGEARAVQGALRLSSHVLKNYPTHLPSQLQGRLCGIDDAGVQAFLAESATTAHDWLRPRSASLATHGGPLLRTLQGHESIVRAVAVTADDRVVSGSADGTLRVWDLVSGAHVTILANQRGAVCSVAVTADGRRAVSGAEDGTVKVWDLGREVLVSSFGGHLGDEIAVAVTGDGQRVVSGSIDCTVKVWDLERGTLVSTRKIDDSWVLSVAVTADGRRVVSGLLGGTVEVWDADLGAAVATLKGHEGVALAVAVTADGRRVVSGSRDGAVKVWDPERRAPVSTSGGHEGEVSAVAITADGRRVVSGAAGERTVRVWDVDTGTVVRILDGHKGGVWSVAVTPDGRRALSASADDTVRVWDVDAGTLVATFQGNKRYVTALAVTPDGRRAVWGTHDGSLEVWNLDSGALLATLEGHEHEVCVVAVGGDGCRALSVARDNMLKVWDLDTRSLVTTCQSEADALAATAMTADCERVVQASKDGTLIVWDTTRDCCVASFRADAAARCCDVTPDGRTIVAGDGFGGVHFLEYVEGSR